MRKSPSPRPFPGARKTSFLAVCALSFLPLAAAAQVDDLPTAPQSGSPGFSFDPDDQSHNGSGIDSISPFNGQLAIAIPIGPVYQVGPNLSFQVQLNYSSRVWAPGTWALWPPTCSPSCTPEPYMPLQGDPALGLGWSFSLGKIVEVGAGAPAAYIAPDGSAHRLYNKRFFNVGSPDGFFYTRDGTYLRVQYQGASTGYWMWSQSGNKTTFGKHVGLPDTVNFDDQTTYLSDFGRGRNGWHATSIANPYGDAITVTYQPSASFPWVPYQITVPSIGGSSRVITVNMNGSLISGFDVPTFNGVNAHYALNHSSHGSLQRPIGHPTASTSAVNMLDNIGLPNAGYASSYSFTYVDGASSVAYSRGALKSQTLPTGATMTYDYGTWTFYHANILNRYPGTGNCAYPPPPFSGRPIHFTGNGFEPILPPISDCTAPDRVAGIVQRTVTYTTLNSPDTAVTKYFQYDFPNGEPNNQTGAQTETLVVSPMDAENQQHSTTYLFTASTASGSSGDITGPLVGALIRTAVFAGDASSTNIGSGGVCGSGAIFCITNALRVQKMTYGTDPFDASPGAFEGTEANRRLTQDVTIYNPIPVDQSVTGKFHQVDYTFDSIAGQYQKQSHSGNIGGDGRETETTWTTHINASDWKLDLPQTVVLRTMPGGSVFSTASNSFDSNGFVTSSTITDTAGGNGALQRSSPRDAHGFPLSDTLSHAGTSYTLNLTFLAGTLKTEQWSGFTWFAANNTIDSTTGLVSMSTDLAGLSMSLTYDLFGRPRVATPPGGDAVTTTTYVSPTETTSVRSGPLATEYAWSRIVADSLGRPIKVQRKMPNGAISKKVTKFDRQGNTVFESEWVPDTTIDSSAPGSSYSNFDHFGRSRQNILADGKVSTVDYADTSNPNSVWFKRATINDVGGSASVTKYRSDAFGNLTTVTEPPPISLDTTYTYDPQDQLTGVTQGNQTRSYTWDAFGFLRREAFPEVQNQNWSYSYDALGNVISETQPAGPGGSTIARSYDGAGRLTQMQVNSVSYVVNCYDGNGPCPGNINFTGGTYPRGKLTTRVGYNPAAAPPASIRQDFDYSDRAGRLSARTTTFSIGSAIPPQTEAWIYDLSGQTVSYSHPRSSGLFVVQTVRDHGYPTAVRANGLPVVVSTSYEPSGMLGSYVTGNDSGHNVATTIAINTSTYLSRANQISTSGASTNFDTGLYTYDGAGNIRQMGSDTFGYDALSRLTSANLSGLGAQGFGYDRWANLTGTTGINARSYSVNASYNRLMNASYDSRGNLLAVPVANPTDTYDWDALNRNVRYRGPSGSGVDWKYLYDGGGERLLKIPISGASADYIWAFRDEGSRVATEYLGPILSRDNVYLGNLLVGSFTSCNGLAGPPGWTYYSSDHLGAPRLITDVAGTAVDSRKYWPYGDEAQVADPSSTQRIRFAGMERDTEANRFYDHARSYDFQSIGRFLSPDILDGSPSDPQQWNRYGYVTGNPLSLTDPFGLSSDEGFANVPGCTFDDCTLTIFSGGAKWPLGVPSGTFVDGVFVQDLSTDITSEGVLTGGKTSFSGVGGGTHHVGFAESLIPIWGSGKEAYYDFSEGRWVWGVFNTALAVSDVFLVKSAVTGLAKGAFKVAGSHTWSATSKWLTNTGWREFKGQHIHHWLLHQNEGLGRYAPEWLKNQPWNLMPMSSAEFHQALHGFGEMGAVARVWFGTPAWSHLFGASVGGRAARGGLQ